MRFIPVLIFCLLAFACDPGERGDTVKAPDIDTNLRLPEISAGMIVDTTLSSLHVYRRTVFTYSDTAGVDSDPDLLIVKLDTTAGTDVINIYADALIAGTAIDSIVRIYCEGKDIRFIGTHNGLQLAVPFHALHRFPEVKDTLFYAESDAHLTFIDAENVSSNTVMGRFDTDGRKYFSLFYGDAFNPNDTAGFPAREPNRQTVEQLMLEGQGWDGVDFRATSDSAQRLSAYNEFVNKLEIFDKVGSFCTMRMAIMSADVLDANWERVLSVFSMHFDVLQSRREDAKKYLADKIANEGGDPSKYFTDEDLRLLYPDRLVLGKHISGVYEHRYDPFLIAKWFWKDEIPQIKPPPVAPGHGGNWENQFEEPKNVDKK